MKGELNLEELDTVQAQGELNDRDLEGVVGGKDALVVGRPGWGGGGWGGGGWGGGWGGRPGWGGGWGGGRPGWGGGWGRPGGGRRW